MSANPAGAGSLWGREPGLISLRDFMEEFRATDVAAMIANLERRMAELRAAPPADIVHPALVAVYEETILGPAENVSRLAGLRQSLAMAERMRSDLKRGANNAAAAEAFSHFEIILLNEMHDCRVYVAPKERVACFNNDRLFGDAVHDAFPSARMDIREAGNCWLFGRNNAVVYHLMCAAEVGLRALAADRRVALVQKGSPLPLELAQWGEILQALDDKVLPQIRKWAPTLAREEALQFYSRAFREARSFNDGVRRHAMHARGTVHEDDETQALMGHVRRFMQTLAAKVSEAATMPEVWT